MRRIFTGLALLALIPACLVAGLLVTGTINTASLHMLLNNMVGIAGPPADAGTVQRRLEVPADFTLDLYVANLPQARFLHVTPAGDLLVSRPHAGDILLLRRDANADGQPDGRDAADPDHPTPRP